MVFIILTIDRALIKGINRHNKKRIFPLLFRIVIALTIGSFMAQPAVLYMFDKDIMLQTSIDNENRKINKRRELDLLFNGQKNKLMVEKQSLQKAITDANEEVSGARQAYLAETDGSGGTGSIGLKDIALAKGTEYLKLDAGYQSTLEIDQAKIENVNAALNELENKIKNGEADFEHYLNNGFLTRAEALTNILKNNPPLQWRYYLIICILMLIEMMPVISKPMLPPGSYDEKVMLREKMEIDMAVNNMRREQELKEHYNQLAFENDALTIILFFSFTKNDRDEKMKSFINIWKEENRISFDSLWEKMKKDILTKQEN